MEVPSEPVKSKRGREEWDPGELGKLGGVSTRSAGPILGEHSAWACQAALSSVHESGPHSSEKICRKVSHDGLWRFLTLYDVLWRFWSQVKKATEIVTKCRTKCRKMVAKCRRLSCTPLWAQCHRALELPTSHSRAHACHWDRRSFLATVRSGPTVWILTSSHSSEPCGSMMWTSARWMGRTLPGAGCPSSWIGLEWAWPAQCWLLVRLARQAQWWGL